MKTIQNFVLKAKAYYTRETSRQAEFFQKKFVLKLSFHTLAITKWIAVALSDNQNLHKHETKTSNQTFSKVTDINLHQCRGSLWNAVRNASYLN